MRIPLIRRLIAVTFFLAGLLALQSPVRAAPISYVGDLSDGAVHVASLTGFWTLSVNVGDNIIVTVRRLSAFDPVAGAWNGVESDTTNYSSVFSNSTNTVRVGSGDDQLPAFCCGGGFGDPQFAFVAGSTGVYTIGAFEFLNLNIQNLDYSVSAVGSTATVPEPTTIALLSAGLLGLGYVRRRKAG